MMSSSATHGGHKQRGENRMSLIQSVYLWFVYAAYFEIEFSERQDSLTLSSIMY